MLILPIIFLFTAVAAAYYRPEVHINCGGKSDAYYQSDLWIEYPLWIVPQGNYRHASGDSGELVNGTDFKSTLALRSSREGQDGSPFGYKITDMQNGVYECYLAFSETNSQYFQNDSRVMTATINGISQSGIDVYKEARGSYKPLTKTFRSVKVRSSSLDAWIKPQKGDGFISALSCLKLGWKEEYVGSMSEVHVNCGGQEPMGKYIPEEVMTRPNYVLVWGSSIAYTGLWFSDETVLERMDEIDRSSRGAENGAPFGWQISNMRPGAYDCLLRFGGDTISIPFVERNVFTVSVNGIKSGEIDVHKMAGGNYTPWSTTLSNIQVNETTDYSIKARIDTISGNGFVSAISCQKVDAT